MLIVEDDFLTRMHAAEMIADAGFDVVESANADEAILVLEVRLDITVVFTDIQMPGSMDGLELAAYHGGDGRQLRSSRLRGLWMFDRMTFPKVDASCQSPTAQSR